MTREEVLAAALRGVCPRCGTHEVTGQPVSVENARAWQRVSCDRCGARWTEVYILNHAELDED